MTTEVSDLKALTVIMNALRRFNTLDSKMQVSTILALLEVAVANAKHEDISVQDIEKNVGIKSGAASRNAYYWGEGHQEMTGGYEMITIGFGEDRRKRSLVLTNKGRAFIADLVRGVQSYGKATG
ncbi:MULTISPECIES: hypothetical protein [unclassified Mesorhizobium]|uniref:hypothetical protein n=1 Tax=unclassified Mesorhizobium TaxID=325217 RepID=UPI0003CFF817|nr:MULTISPECIES: hypothetical protein [unclassified Mesorhizobium]ESZ07246.1 hypothetical protein X736_13215 [Mesorhizobium sp. L2C089B000]WJI52982.1 hypothetical protein NLY44_10090 [Mesorhizobium sp. C089B]